MRYLFEVYHEKAHDEAIGQIWLTARNIEQIERYGSCRIMTDDWPPEVLAASVDVSNVALDVFTVWLDTSHDRSARGQRTYRLYTDGSAEQIAKARRVQEQKFRFPVPISLFPG